SGGGDRPDGGTRWLIVIGHEHLVWDACALGPAGEFGGTASIGEVTLGRVDLQNWAGVGLWAAVGVVAFGVVGVHEVAAIGGQQNGGRDDAAVQVGRNVLGCQDASQHLFQQWPTGGGTSCGAGCLVVDGGQHGDLACFGFVHG